MTVPKTVQEVESRVTRELTDARKHPKCASLARHRIPPERLSFLHPKLEPGWICFRDARQDKALILCADPYDDRDAWILAEAATANATDPEATIFAGTILEFLDILETLERVERETQTDQPQQSTAPLPPAPQTGPTRVRANLRDQRQ